MLSAVVAKYSREHRLAMKAALAVAAVLVQPAFTWQNIARCFSGKQILKKDVPGSNGTIGSMVNAMQKMVPAYGDLVVLSQTEDEQNCNDAANGINGNHALVGNIAAAYNMSHVSFEEAGELANETKYYFYAYNRKNFHDYEYMATCVPGGVVGFNVLNLTKGVIGAYTIVLQALMHNFGDLMFLGSSYTAGECFVPQDAINTGNSTALNGLKKKQYPNVKDVNMFGSVGTGDPNRTYLYVFVNKDWNSTWGMFAAPIVSKVQKNYGMWTTTTTKAPSESRRRKFSISLGRRRKSSTTDEAKDDEGEVDDTEDTTTKPPSERRRKFSISFGRRRKSTDLESALKNTDPADAVSTLNVTTDPDPDPVGDAADIDSRRLKTEVFI